MAPSEFYLIRIIPDDDIDRITISHEDLVGAPEIWTCPDVLRQRAFSLEDLSLQLGSPEGEAWYTLYYSPSIVIQAETIIGSGTVEKVNKGHAPLHIVLPSSLPEITAIGMNTPRILEQAQLIAPVDSTTGMKRQLSSLTEKEGTVNNDCSTDITEEADSI